MIVITKGEYNVAKLQVLNLTNQYTTEREGWQPYFKDNEGFSGKPLHEVLELAHLDFQAMKLPTWYQLPGSDKWYQSDSYSVVRADTGYELGRGFSGDMDNGQLLDKGYSVVQHEEALGDIFDGVLNAESSAICVNAIGFNGGSKVAISFRMPDEYMVNPTTGDNQTMYFNFFNSFDGTDGVGGSWLNIRPVCQNTFRLARKSGINGYFTRHTQNVHNRLKFKAAEILGLARREFEDINAEFAKWAKIGISDDNLKAFLHAMHPNTGTENQGPANKRENLYQNIANGELVDSNNLTIWDAFNGKTKIENWYRTNKRMDNSVQFDYALNGTGSDNMNTAYNWLANLVG